MIFTEMENIIFFDRIISSLTDKCIQGSRPPQKYLDMSWVTFKEIASAHLLRRLSKLLNVFFYLNLCMYIQFDKNITASDLGVLKFDVKNVLQ